MTKKVRIWQEILYWVLIAALLTAGGFLLFTKLGEAGISDCDEARHGVNAYEMMQNNDMLVSTYRGEVDYWNLKPTLSYYSIMLGYKLFGFTALGMRFYSAVSMLAAMVVLAVWMKRKHGSVASLACQMFMLACSLIYGPHFARFGDADAQMLLFYIIAMLCMLQSVRNTRWLYGSAVCFGLAFMSKSWHAALIPVTCFLFVCVTGQIKTLNWKQYLLLIFFGLLPVAPWAIARIRFDGLEFFHWMLRKDVYARATTVHEGHKGNMLYYVRILLRNKASLLAIIAAALGVAGKVARRSRITTHQWGVALWFAVPLVFYTLCVSKLEWYIFVSLPALAVALGMFAGQLTRGMARSKKLASVCAALLVVIFAVTGVLGWGNWQKVDATENTDTYQRLINEWFWRETDAGTRVYIQYESENSYYPTDYRSWVQDDLLAAVLAGDVECMDGGIEAFLEEEEYAYLIVHEVGMDWDLLGEFPVVYEEGPLMVLENFN